MLGIFGAPHRRQKPPYSRRFVIDSLTLGEGRHIVHALLEVDVTDARRRVRERTDDVSFTAYVAACVGRTMAAHPIAHAYRSMRGDLVTFDDVDVCVIVETERTSRGSFPLPVVLRRACSRSVRELTDDIRRAQAHPERSPNLPGNHWFGRVPAPIRRRLMKLALRNPFVLKARTGTTIVTSVGMFGETAGFGIASPTHYTTTVLVGSIVPRHRMNADGQVEKREELHLTLSFDHDIVDGGPAARFAADLVERLESAAPLDS